MSQLTMSDDVAVSRPAGRQRLLWAGGSVFDIVLSAEQTGGHVAILDQVGRRGDVTPMHIHRSEAEIFYVLDGAIRAFHGGKAVDVDAGSAIYLPAGQEHGFGVVSDTVRLITVTTPGSFSGFIGAAGVPVDGDVPAQWEYDVSRIMAAAGQFDIEITGPPPSLNELA